MNRRKFISQTSKGILIPSLVSGMGVRAFANSPMIQALYGNLVDTDRVLVLIYLGGGNDGLNTVVPVDQYDKLFNARDNVILPQNSLIDLDGVDNVKLHPALDTFRNMYHDGNLGIIQNVGYPNQDFSHFRSTDIWMTGSDANEVIPTGWAGRYLQDEYPNYPFDYPNETMPDPLAIELGYDLSVMFQGQVSAMGMIVGDPTDFYALINNETEIAPDTKSGRKLDYIRLISRQSQVYGEVIRDAAEGVTNQLDYPEDNDLAQQLKVVSRLIAGGLKTRLYMVSHHGFDTHDTQVDWNDHTNGEHAYLLGQLSDAVDAFTKDLNHLGINDRVTGMTFSEFGRRIQSNASNGTDHGSAAPMFVFGDAIAGGIYGENPTIPEFIDWDSNLEMQYDFRSVYSTIFKDWFCVDEAGLESVFFNQFETLPLFSNSPCLSTSIHEANQHAGKTYIENYPNPFSHQTTIRFESRGGYARIDVYDARGNLVDSIVNSYFTRGSHEIVWITDHLPVGTYYARMHTQFFQQARAMLKV